jgi:hypothetical protein
MANSLYGKAKEKFATGAINWTGDNIKCALIDSAGYTPNLSTHEFLSDVGGIEETSANLSGKTATLGACGASNVTFSGTSGNNCEYILVYKDTGVAGTSPLIALIDTAGGLPVTLGGNVQVTWNSGIVFNL